MRSYIIITGVSGSGKTTLGRALAERLGAPFYDADDYHPAANVQKMTAGIPLDDDDRKPWLQVLNTLLQQHEGPLVLACSALKERYRQQITRQLPATAIQWVHLHGSPELIRRRLQARNGHFMAASMLDSQLQAYEPPAYGLQLDVAKTTDELLVMTLEALDKAEIGLMGLGVMGLNLARNLAGNGFRLALYNRRLPGKEEEVAAQACRHYPELKDALPFEEVGAFVKSIARPRRILLMVSAGAAVDELILQLLPWLEAGDVVADGGNTHYRDTERRQQALAARGIHWLGCGISGGEAGALHGPAVMPGGAKKAYNLLEPLLSRIAALGINDQPCCRYIGKGGAGHFVKMVHNGIEYAEMQLIAEVYGCLRYDLGHSPTDVARIFSRWQRGAQESNLLGLTIDILNKKDVDGSLLIDHILDSAGAKGTGNWTTAAAGELGVPAPGLTAALNARYLSAQRQDRLSLSALFAQAPATHPIQSIDLESTYAFCRLMSHLQGLALIQAASDRYQWGVNLKTLLRVWSGGCIIRSTLLEQMRKATSTQPHWLCEPGLFKVVRACWPPAQQAAAALALSPQPYPVIQASVDYFKYLTTARSTAYLLQAQRDYFGAHTYQRLDDPEGLAHHTDW